MGSWQDKLSAEITMDMKNFHRLFWQVKEQNKKDARELLIDTAKRFAGSAANATPPGQKIFNVPSGTYRHVNSAKIPVSMLYRRVRNLSDPDEINGQHREFLRNAHYGKNKWAFAVHALTPRRRFKFFATEAEAKAFAAIPTRGAGKYGWLQGVVALGGAARSVTPASFPFSGNAGKLMEKAGTTQISGGELPRIEIVNRSSALGMVVAALAAAAGLRIANTGLRHALRNKEKNMEKKFNT